MAEVAEEVSFSTEDLAITQVGLRWQSLLLR
jgi:hypothetical protein